MWPTKVLISEILYLFMIRHYSTHLYKQDSLDHSRSFKTHTPSKYSDTLWQTHRLQHFRSEYTRLLYQLHILRKMIPSEELTLAISIHFPRPSCHEKTSILGYKVVSLSLPWRTKTEQLTSVYGLYAGLNLNLVFPVLWKNSSMNA